MMNTTNFYFLLKWKKNDAAHSKHYSTNGRTEDLEHLDDLIPMDEVLFVWPSKHSCTNEHFNMHDNFAYQDAHSVEINTTNST